MTRRSAVKPADPNEPEQDESATDDAEELRNEHLAAVATARERLRVGRNEPCPCGSGRKYKKCCLAGDEAMVRSEAARREAEQAARNAGRPPRSERVDDADGDWGRGSVGEERFGPEVKARLEEAWSWWQTLRRPSVEQAEKFLTDLLELPAEATSWNEVMHELAGSEQTDVARCFRRIAAAVQPSKENGLGFFYWAAAEIFVDRGMDNLLPEVAAGFRTLDIDSYDADALTHVEDYLLAAGCEQEALELAEHFLPIERVDELMPWAVPQRCNMIFELRVGRALRAGAAAAPPIEELVRQLLVGLEDDIDGEAARTTAEAVCMPVPAGGWTSDCFKMPQGDLRARKRAWQDYLQLWRTQVHVAREAWEIDGLPPGCMVRGLAHTFNSLYEWLAEERPQKKPQVDGNLLECLLPATMEKRVARSCRDMMGINGPRARLILQAHAALLGFAVRHGLRSADELGSAKRELARLAKLVEPGGKSYI